MTGHIHAATMPVPLKYVCVKKSKHFAAIKSMSVRGRTRPLSASGWGAGTGVDADGEGDAHHRNHMKSARWFLPHCVFPLSRDLRRGQRKHDYSLVLLSCFPGGSRNTGC